MDRTWKRPGLAAQTAQVAVIRFTWWVVGVPFSCQLGSTAVCSPRNSPASLSLPTHRPLVYHPPIQEGVRHNQSFAGDMNNPVILVISNDKIRNCIYSTPTSTTTILDLVFPLSILVGGYGIFYTDCDVLAIGCSPPPSPNPPCAAPPGHSHPCRRDWSPLALVACSDCGPVVSTLLSPPSHYPPLSPCYLFFVSLLASCPALCACVLSRSLAPPPHLRSHLLGAPVPLLLLVTRKGPFIQIGRGAGLFSPSYWLPPPLPPPPP
jgi:hypothetical protein